MLSTFFYIFFFSSKPNDDDDDDAHGGGSDIGSGMATRFQINFELALKWIHNVLNIKRVECVIRSRAQHKISQNSLFTFTWIFIVVVVVCVLEFCFYLAMMSMAKYLLERLLSLLWCWGIYNSQWTNQKHKHRKTRAHTSYSSVASSLWTKFEKID